MPDTLITGFFSAAGTPLELWQYDPAVTPDPDPKTCQYTHLDLSTENLGWTQRYNCWGFTFIPRRYWLTRTTVNTLLQDNCDPVADGSVEVGDVIRYQKGGVTQHTGRVWQTDGAGHAAWIRSKWGSLGEYIHLPDDVPASYGTDLAYFRQKAPVLGDAAEANIIGDLWMMDSPSDTGEQGRRAPWWTSPDILVDVPPYDGVPDLNPVFDHPNRVWGLLRNRGNQRIDNVYVRFYWADPNAGLPPSAWNLIAATAGHPNPVGPISINAGAGVETDYVEWTPTAAPAHQCLLAIACVNDNPLDSSNPDPLVYPFEIPWDNNIAQRNVHILELENGAKAKLVLEVALPFMQAREAAGSLMAVLTASPAHPLLGFARQIRPLKVSLSLDNGRASSLRLWDGKRSRERLLPFRGACPRERPILGATLPLALQPRERRRLEVNIAVPRDVPKGSHYYLHIVQTLAGMVCGGYTILVLVRP